MVDRRRGMGVPPRTEITSAVYTAVMISVLVMFGLTWTWTRFLLEASFSSVGDAFSMIQQLQKNHLRVRCVLDPGVGSRMAGSLWI